MSVTIVTGIWDIKRDSLGEGWSRGFEHYLNNLEKLLKCEDNIIVFIEEKYRDWVMERRSDENTQVIVRELDWFRQEFFDKIQKIRNDNAWKNQAGWLPESTQARLEMYNPIVMSKMFLLNDARILDRFNSTHLVWVDGGLTNTVNDGYFWHDRVVPKLEKYFNKFSFVAFPYDGKVEIHGFEYQKMCELAGNDVDKVCRGGIFGGPVDSISNITGIYYNLMSATLGGGFMGTEESLFTIMLYQYPEIFQYYQIEDNGLLGLFFENLKNDNLEAKIENKKLSKSGVTVNEHDSTNIGLYVLTFNSPDQFTTLCKSMNMYDRSILSRTKKFLINNSTDKSTREKYVEACQEYGFEMIEKDNIGICGGRQFIAEHAEENELDYHMFFEDDMFFYTGTDDRCRNGFVRKIDNFLSKLMAIAWNENFDYLKFNFSEFYGDNQRQWAWHNVPGDVRMELFPESPVKSEANLGDFPYMKYTSIRSMGNLAYATGDIYYCNWPQVVSRQGNKKMFLDVKWNHPYEQTWMSYIYQETVKGNIKTGILLATPTEHDRFFNYPGEERREN